LCVAVCNGISAERGADRADAADRRFAVHVGTVAAQLDAHVDATARCLTYYDHNIMVVM